jgi:hypothetical protein
MKKIDTFIQQYNNHQIDSIEKFPPYVVREFTPLTFLSVNTSYRTEIKKSTELWKFADCMQETRYEENLQLLGGALSQREFDLSQEIVLKVLGLTLEIGNPVVVKNSLTRALLHLRCIKAIAKFKGKQLDQLKILEIGPGSGYLGLICNLENINYYGLEITQSLYVYQHFLWSNLGSKILKECFLPEDVSRESFAHIPWWTFVDEKLILPKFDIVVMNHVVNEISPMGFRFEIQRLLDSFDQGILMVEKWGGGLYSENCEYLDNIGVSFLHQSHVSNSKYLPVSILKFPKSNSSDSISNDVEAFYKKLGLKTKRYLKHLINDMGFFYILKEIKDLCKIVLLRRRINKFYSSEIITNMSVFFKMDREQISKEDLDKFYLDLKLNGYNIHTKDEEFLRFIRKNNPDI